MIVIYSLSYLGLLMVAAYLEFCTDVDFFEGSFVGSILLGLIPVLNLALLMFLIWESIDRGIFSIEWRDDE